MFFTDQTVLARLKYVRKMEIPKNPFISLYFKQITSDLSMMSENDGSAEIYDVVVSMKISKNGQDVENKDINFGKLKEAQVKGLTDIFSMMAANIEYIKKLSPQFEKLDKSKPTYLQ